MAFGIEMTAFELRAIRAGEKTMVRRVVSPQPADMSAMPVMLTDGVRFAAENDFLLCPYGAAGDRLFATLADPGRLPGQNPHQELLPVEEKPELLDVVGHRVERLHAISDADVDAEGAYFGACCMCGEYLEPHGGEWTGNWHSPTPMGTPHQLYAELWDSIYGDGAFAANPWVWVVIFKRVGA